MRRFDGVYVRTYAVISKEYHCHPIRFFSIVTLVVAIGLGLKFFWGPITFPTLGTEQESALTDQGSGEQKVPAEDGGQVLGNSVQTASENAFLTEDHAVIAADQPLKLEIPEKGFEPEIEVHGARTELSGKDDFTITLDDTGPNKKIAITPNGLGAKPGLYEVVIKNPQTGEVLKTEEIAWGVLAFNPDYAIYPPGTQSNLAMAVLDDRGKMVCNAELALEITDPSGAKTTLQTADKTIVISPDCQVYGPTSEPDYHTTYQTGPDGDYRVKLVAKVGQATRTLTDTFSVKGNEAFYVQRLLPTRIYPPTTYEAKVIFQPKQSGTYAVEESVPKGFEISETKAEITAEETRQVLRWSVEAQANEDQTLSYKFKAPNISPYLFLVGPLKIENLKIENSTKWTEPRSWQIASDNACQSAGTGNWSDAAMWTGCGGTVPQAADTVQILNTHNITEDTASVTVAGVTIDVGGTLTVSTTNAITVSGNWSNSGTFTSATGTVTFSATTTGKTLGGTMTGTTGKFYNIIFNGAGGGWTLNAALEVANNFDITNGTFDTNSTSNYAVTIAGNLTGNTGTWSLTQRASTWTISGNWNTSAILTDDVSIVEGSSTVVMDGTGTKTITTGSTSTWNGRFWNLNVGQASGKTTQMQQSFGVENVLTLGAGTFDLNSKTLFMVSSPTNPFSLSGTFGTGNGSIYFHGGSANVNLPAYTYNTGLTNSLPNTYSLIFQGTTTFTGNLTVSDCCSRANITNLNGQTVTFNGNVTFSQSQGTLTMGAANLTVKGNWTNSVGGTFNADTGTVDFAATSGTQTVNTGGTGSTKQFYNLTHSGASTLSLSTSAVQVANDLSNTGGTISGSVDVTVNGSATGVGAITLSGSSTFTQRVTAAENFGTTSSTGVWTFVNLTFSNSHASTGFTVTTQTGGSGGITVSGILLVGASGDGGATTLDAGNRTWTLSGTGGNPFQILASPAGVLTSSTSTFKYTNVNSGTGLTTIEQTSSGYNNLELNDGLIGYWRLNDGSGTTATDGSGNGNTGNLGASTAQPTWSSTVYDSTYYGGDSGSLDFDGGDYVTIPYSSTLAPSAGVTVSAWVKFDSVTSGRKIVSKTESGGWQLGINEPTGNCTASQLCFLINIGGAYRKAEWPTSNLSTGTWYHIVGTYSGTAVKLYVNNSNVATTNITGSITYNNSNPVCIGSEVGASACTSGDYFDGIINDVRIYDRGIGATEISDIYGGGSATYATFQPEGNITVAGNLGLRSGKLDAVSGSNYNISVGGSYSNFGYYLPQNSTISFTATATGKTLTGVLSGTYGSFYNLTFNGSGGGWSSSDNAVVVTNDLTMTAGTYSGTKNMTVNGNVAGTAGAITLTGGTFEQRVTANKNFGTTSGSTAWTFNDLTFSNGNSAPDSPVTYTTQTGGSGGITVSGILRVGKSGDVATNTTTLDAGNRTWTLSGTGGDPFQLLASPAGALTAATSTFIYTGNNGSGNTTVQTATYYNLTINTGGAVVETYVLEGTTGTGNDLTVTFGTLDTTASNYALNITRDLTLTNAASVVLIANGSTITVGRNFTDTGNKFTEGSASTVSMTGTGDLITGGGSLYNLTIAGTVTKADASSTTLAITHNLDIQNTKTFSTGTTCGQVNFTGGTGATLTIAGTLSGSCGFWVLSSTEPTFSFTGTISVNDFIYQYSGDGTNYTIPAYTYGTYLTLYPSTNSNTYTIGAGTMSAGGYIIKHNTAAKTLTLNNSVNNTAMTTTIRDFDFSASTGNVSFTMGSATYTNQRHWINLAGSTTLTPGTSTVNFNGGGNVTSASQSFYKVTITTGTVTPQDAMVVTNDLTMTGGTLNGTQNVTVNGNVAGTAGTITLTGGTFKQQVSSDKNFGTTSGSTAWTFNNLSFTTCIGICNPTVTITTQTGGTGGITVTGVLTVGDAGDTSITALNAGNRIWTLSGTGGDPFQLTASPAAVLVGGTSKFYYTGANASGNTTIQSTSGSYYDLEINAGDTFVLEADTVVTNNLTITHVSAILDVTASNYALTIGNNYSNSGTFTANSGTVTFNATDSGNTLGGTMTGSSAFYNLTFNGVSGAWTFNAAVAATNDYTGTNGSVTANGNNLTVTRDFTLANTAGVDYVAGSTTVTVSRHWTDSGCKYTEGTSTVALNGDGTLTEPASTCLNNLSVAYSGKTTTFPAIAGWSLSGQLTFNGGTATAGAGGYFFPLVNSTNTTPIVFASATTITGSNVIIMYSNAVGPYTVTVAGGNYGSWGVDVDANNASVTFQLGGDLTTTNLFRQRNNSGGDTIFNTQNYNLTALTYRFGQTSYGCLSTTANWGSSTITLSAGAASDTLYVDSNCGAHTLNMQTSSLSLKGNIKFVNGTGTVTVDPGTSTATWTHTSGTSTYAPNSQSLYNVVLNGSGGTVTPSGTVSITNDLTITLGTFDTTTSNHAVNVTRDLTIAGSASAVLRARTSTITVSRHWTLDTGGVFTRDSSTVQLNGTGNIAGTGTTQFENLTVAYNTKTTTMTRARTDVFGILTIGDASGGTMTCSVTCEFELFRTAGADLVLGTGATLSGSNATFQLRKQSASTVTVTGGTNYGTWNILMYVNVAGLVTYNVGGNITTTGYMQVKAQTGATATFNTQNYTINADKWVQGDSTSNGVTTSNWGSSTATFNRASATDTFYVNSNGGAQVANFQTASISATGNVLFVNGTGTLTVDKGTSTFTFAPTTGTSTFAPNGQSLYNVIVNGAATVQPNAAVAITNDLTMTAGTINGTQNITVNGNVAGTAGIISLTGGTFEQRMGAASKNFGTTSGSTAWTFYDLTFSNASGAPAAGRTATTQTGGTGGITVSDVLRVGKSGDGAGATTTLDAGNRTWTLSGTTGDSFQLLASPAGALTAATSTFTYTGANAGGNSTIQVATYCNLSVGGTTADTLVLEAATTTSNAASCGDLTIVAPSSGSNTLDTVSGSNWGLSIGGNYANNSVFTAQSGTVTFTATDTGNTMSGTLSGSSAFYNLVFSGSGGEWTPSAAVAVSNDLTMTAGSLLGTQNITVNGNVAGTAGIINLTGGTFTQRASADKNFGTTSGSTTWTFSSLTFSNSCAICSGNGITFSTQAGTGGITVSGVLKVGDTGDGDNSYLNAGAGGRTWTLSGTGGDPFQILTGAEAGDLIPNVSTFSYTGANAGGNTTVQAETYCNLSVGGTTADTLVLEAATTTSNAASCGDLTIVAPSSGSNTLDTVSGSNWGLSIGGNYANNSVFTARSGTVTFTATDTGNTLSGTLSGSSAFYNLVFSGSGGEWTPSAAVAVSNDLTMTAGSLLGTQNLTVSGGDITGDGTINLTGGTTTLTADGNFGGATAWTFYTLKFGNTSTLVPVETVTATGAGGITVTDVLTINRHSGLGCAMNTLNAGSKTWTFSGTTGAPLVVNGTLTPSTSTITFTGNNGSGNTSVPGSGAACGDATYNNLTLNNASETFAVSGTTNITINGNLTITNGTFTAGSGTATVKGNYANNGTFTANGGTITLSGTSTQTMSGTLTGSSAFYNLTISNSSGAVSGCSTSFTPGVDFAAAATISNLYTITTAGVKVEYNSGSTYAVNDMNWNGGGTSIYFRNSNLEAGTWLLNVTAVGNAQDKVSYVDVGRSDASGGAQIIASDGTNTDCSNNTNWQFDETLTLGLDTTSISFGTIQPGVMASNQTNVLTASSNANSGYAIYAWATQAMTMVRGADSLTIADWTGTNATPTTWASGAGFGYTTDDTSVACTTGDVCDGGDRFGSGTKFAGFTNTGPGKIVADRTAPVTGATNTITYRLGTDATQAAGTYSTVVVYIISTTFP